MTLYKETIMDFNQILNVTTSTGTTVPFRPSDTKKGNRVLSVLHRTPQGDYIWRGSGAMVEWSIMNAKNVTDIKSVKVPGFGTVPLTEGVTDGGNTKMSGRATKDGLSVFFQVSRSTNQEKGTDRAFVMGTISKVKERKPKVKVERPKHNYTF